MKTNLLLILAFFLPFAVSAQTNIPSSEWNKVYDFEKQSLPQSALEVVNQIYQKALSGLLFGVFAQYGWRSIRC